MVQIIKTLVPLPPNRKYSVLEILQFTVLLSVVLYFGKTLFIPLSFAMLISFILYPICKWFEKKKINKTVSIFLSISIVFLLLGAITFLLLYQIGGFLHEWPTFKVKFSESLMQLFAFLKEKYGINTDSLSDLPKNLMSSSRTQILGILANMLYSMSISTFFIIVIPVFSALILYYREMLVNVLYMLFPSSKNETIREILAETIHAYYNFIKGMLLVYLIVGILNSVGLAIIGIPHPFLFGFIASILTFIPYAGIIISSLIPITISWITFDSLWYPLGVVLVFTIVQILEANIIFPFAVGNRLKINTMAIIVVIVAGGILWGAAGMILFIPFISIVKLIADRTESLKMLSLLLGSDSGPKKSD
ncbi:AI-2E family transporter [Lutibacter sp.]|uniref:AI-2E family transporter n=1 Tax=Lutibacter sp. TaxID=1925666 RepID=UPI0035684A58